jgi:hypothetical protein
MSITEGGDTKFNRRSLASEAEPIPYSSLDVYPAAKMVAYTEKEYQEWREINFKDGFDNTVSKIKLWKDPNGKWWIVEGRRRYRACKDIGHAFIAQDFDTLPQSTDPWAYAFKSNLGRFQLDTKGKHKAIANALGMFPDETDAAMARRCHCDPKTVKKVRDEIAKRVDKLKEDYKELNVAQRKEFVPWATDNTETLEFPSTD